MTPQEIKTNNMEEQTLFHKMYLEISANKNDGNTVTAMACERVAIQAQIDLLQEMAKDTENTNANFRLKLIVKINELENKLI
jgi:hypothetical protein